MKCYHGTVLTVNAHNDVANYLVEDGGKIVFVGNELPEKYAGVPVTELGKGALIPRSRTHTSISRRFPRSSRV